MSDLKVISVLTKQQLAAKLKEIDSEFQDSDMLIDFVSVMVENQKSLEYIREQLLDCKVNINIVTSTEETDKITNWLREFLTNEVEMTNSNEVTRERDDLPVRDHRDREYRRRSVSPNDRHFSRRNREDLRGLLNRRNGRQERYSNRQAPYRRPVEREKQPLKLRCTFYPNCAREDCPFIHPTEPCPDENCTKGNQCHYIHPPPPPPVVACKFGQYCTKPDCQFSHPSPAAVALQNTAICRYYPNCLNPQCTFVHPGPNAPIPPKEVAAPTEQSTVSVVMDVTPDTNPALIKCKFDPYCKRFGCHFLHPSRSKSKNKVLIVNNDQVESSTNNRIFALPSDSVEKVGMEVDA